MQGILIFRSLSDAIRAGFAVYDRTEYGYLVRTRTSAGWAIALAIVSESRQRPPSGP